MKLTVEDCRIYLEPLPGTTIEAITDLVLNLRQAWPRIEGFLFNGTRVQCINGDSRSDVVARYYRLREEASDG